jgi:acetylornithine deacetylase/succinyl-diaminopimelate desuccinylase-like protein
MCALVAAALLPAAVFAQANPAASDARAWRRAHERAIVDEFVTVLAVPNVTADRANVQRNADLLVAMLEKRGVAARQLTKEGANPVVLGEIRTPGALRTIVLYAHYDGQGLDEKEWSTPPFAPTLRTRPLEAGGTVIPLPPAGTPFDPESRLYARSAGDDKVPIIAMLTALDALRASGRALKSNIKLVFDGEEERGSPNLEAILAANKQLLGGDVWLICDGPVHQTRRPLVYFGARDNVSLEVTVYGPRAELHSGHYGNWAPNPALELAKLLASLKDDDDRVLVEHFYDDVEPLGETERQALADAPDIDAELAREFWLGATDGGSRKLVELITQPSLNIHGLASARVGAQQSNVIPATATASLDIRLVKGMDPRATQDRVIEHIRRQGFFVVEAEPSAAVRLERPKVARVQRGPAGPGAVRTPMDLPIAREVVALVESVLGPAVKLPNMGGSLPLGEIGRALGAPPMIVIPIANHDDNQHSFDENLRIQNLWDGIDLMAALLAM